MLCSMDIQLHYNPETGDIKSPGSDMFITRVMGLERHEVKNAVRECLQWWLDNHQELFISDQDSEEYIQELIDRI